MSAQAIDFESASGYSAGEDISSVSEWSKSGADVGKITDQEANGGSQSLAVAASSKDLAVTTTFPAARGDVIFIDMAVRPSADGSAEPQYTVNANGAALAFLKTGSEGTVIAIGDGGNGQSITTGYSFSIDKAALASKWIRVTIREDLKARTWDLYLDGKLTLIDLPMGAAGKSGGVAWSAYASSAGDTYVDDISASRTNPVFADADSDGIPDAVEIATGTNPYVNDRENRDLAGGPTNIEKFLSNSGGEAASSGSQAGRHIIYVDNSVGSDSNTGELSYRTLSQGPKASLGAAIRQADSNTTIALLPTAKTYPIPASLLTKPGSINLMPLGDVSITSTEE
ncbi:MAG TPA: hypothetical protein VIM48_03160 [Chthoniobacterales bacterium]